MKCNTCGYEASNEFAFCPQCGNRQEQQVNQQPQQTAMSSLNDNAQGTYWQGDMGVDPSWPTKSKLAAGLLGIFLGGLGIHKFYLGKVGQGILHLAFCWTFIPAIIGFIEGIIYLSTSDEEFQRKHHVRLV